MTKAAMVANLPVGAINAKIVGNNTLQYDLDLVHERVIRHFDTDVLRFQADGTIMFNTDGHRSTTTKARLNEYQNDVRIWTDKRVWYACAKKLIKWTGQDDKEYECLTPNRDETHVIFADGMTYHPLRGFENCGVKPDPKLIKSIRKYADAFAASLPCDKPDGGDCWICCANSDDPNHLMTHIEDKYYVPRLLHNALKEAQRGDYIFACAFKGDHRGSYYEQLLKSYRLHMAKDIYQYMYRRIIDRQVGERKPTTGFSI